MSSRGLRPQLLHHRAAAAAACAAEQPGAGCPSTPEAQRGLASGPLCSACAVLCCAVMCRAAKRTLVPSSCAMPSASAVLPVPGAPVISSARPANFFCLQGRRACVQQRAVNPQRTTPAVLPLHGAWAARHGAWANHPGSVGLQARTHQPGSTAWAQATLPTPQLPSSSQHLSRRT